MNASAARPNDDRGAAAGRQGGLRPLPARGVRALRARGVAYALVWTLAGGCAFDRSAAQPPRPLPTEADACARTCARLEGCALAPAHCPSRCGLDQARLRPGVQAAFAACLEAQLATCETIGDLDRRQRVSLCWTATLEVWDREVGDQASRALLDAVCARAERCDPGAASSAECVATIRHDPSQVARRKTLAVARPELLAATAACIRSCSCAEPHPIDRCTPAEEAP